MRFGKKIGIIIPFLAVILMSQNIYATNLTYMDAVDFWNNGTKTTRPGTVLSDNNFISSIASSLSPMRITKISFAFPINEQKDGQYINYNFNTGLNIQNGNPIFENSCQGLRASVMYANSNAYNGIATEINQVSVYCSKSSNNKELWIGVTSNAKLFTSQRVSHAYITFENTDNSIFSCNNSVGAMVQLCTSATLNYYRPVNYLQASQDPTIAGQQTIINQNEVIINQNQTQIDQDNEYYNREYDSVDNINNQSSNDIPNSSDQQTTNLIGIISSFLGELGSFQATSCNLTLPFPSFIGGSQIVNICQGKDVLGNFITLFSTLTALMFYIPLAWILLKMIYNEIRSWTNG